MKLDMKNLPWLKVAHHLEHVASMSRALAAALDELLVDVDNEAADGVVNDMLVAAESADAASLEIMADLA